MTTPHPIPAQGLPDDALDLIFDAAPIGLARLTEDGALAHANRPFLGLLGRDAAAARGHPLVTFAHPDDRPPLAAALAALRAGGPGVHRFEQRWTGPDGAWRWVGLTVSASRLPDGAIAHLAALGEDITARREAELALRASEERWQALVHHAADIIAIVDLDGERRYVSPALQRTLGYPTDMAPPVDFGLVHPDDAPAITRQLRVAAASPGTPVPVEYRLHARDGSWHHFEASLTSLLDIPSIGGIVVNARDVTARKAIEAQVAHWALHDTLTGLPNRVLFMDRLGHALDRARRSGQLLAVIALDLDRFSLINESLGHDRGDDLLDSVGARLRHCVRDGDTIARLGGDLFTILLEALDDPAAVLTIAGRIGVALAQPFRLDARTVVVSASLGIALGQHGRQGTNDLLREADSALARAKAGGKGRYEVFDPAIGDPALRRLELEGELRRALDTGGLHLVYQPVRHLMTGQIDRIEALARWQPPRRGVIPPDQFIPLAEETGLIRPLGRWVLREACRQARAWHALCDGLTPAVAVNLSAHEFADPDLADDIARILAETGLPPAALQLEITETTTMRDDAASATTLSALRALGVILALDDFGTGYSSLGQLQHLPVDALKIDRSFLLDIAGDTELARGQALITAITALGHALGLTVTAEGIETPAHLALARAAGCDHGQGYHLARPLPADAVTALLLADLQADPARATILAASSAPRQDRGQ